VTPGASSCDERILLRAATARDARMTRDVLGRAGIATTACDGMQALVQEFKAGAGAVMMVEEAVLDPAFDAFGTLLAEQPPWSDVPVIVLARQGADSAALARILRGVANVTVIERPMRVAALVSAARTALRARNRQYEIRALVADLRETDQRKTEFLATLAHELRNPLAPLSNSLNLLAGHAMPPEAARPVYDLMKRQVEHMVRLIDDLMEVSRITRNKIGMQLAPVSLAQVIADAVELSRPQILAAGHTLALDLGDDPLTMNGDHVRLTQVFSNLLNNAAKYTPPGGRLAVVARRDGGQAVVEVRDSGVGLAPDTFESIFDMFVQVGGTARLAQGGLGIGLTLVKSLVEMHGGRVAARSDGAGQGSTFTVTLPLHDRLPVAAPAPAARRDAELARSRAVLIVDDNRDAADSLALMLQTFGALVTTAYSAEEALRTVEDRGPPDVALLDIGMPGQDGCDLARALRRRPDASAMRLIAVTGWGQAEQRERIAAAGFNDHLIKPVDLHKLLALL
jgi:signal transduction histidine kinase